MNELVPQLNATQQWVAAASAMDYGIKILLKSSPPRPARPGGVGR